ncbi:GIN domain-containing protein [Labilibaculum sp.]|uniref:GIN domain-containing protein n=1 Tax=Labilibaculum sp. TaxID=2060723 RepID=UPI00356720F1
MTNKFLLAIVLFLGFTSCESLNPFEDEGEYTEQKVDLSGVTSIQNDNTFEITLIEDDEEYLLLKGGENKLAKVSIEIDDNQAVIDHSQDNNITNLDLIEAEFHLKNLQTISVNAPADFTSNEELSGNRLNINITSLSELVEMNLNLQYDSLYFHAYGSTAGGYEFSGSCPTASYVLNGIINIKASTLESNQVILAQNGTGEVHVWANTLLIANIYSSGDIYYTGNPEIVINRIQINNQSPTADVLQE